MDRINSANPFYNSNSELEQILDNFSALFDIRIAYFKPDGTEYTIGKGKKISTYCSILREKLNYNSKCIGLDKVKQTRAVQSGQIQSYICHGGCNEVIKPIFHEEELLGFIMIGQACTQKNIPDPVLSDARKAGLEDELTECFHKLPQYDKEKMNSIIQLFSELTDLIFLKGLVKHKELGPVKTVIEYMKRNCPRISLEDAAVMARMSDSRFRHRFKEETGRSFTSYRNAICMTKARILLEENPELSIQEVADRLGYTDPMYFSRAFKQFFGNPPTVFLKTRSRSQ